MAPFWPPGALVNIVSGVLMALLGGALLLLNPRKDWNRVFGQLAAFWGVQIVCFNALRLAPDAAAAAVLAKIGFAFLLPLYFFFALFADIFPRPRRPFGTSPVAVALLLAPAAASLVLLFARPEAFLQEIRQGADGRYTMVWGPLLPFLVTGPFFGALFYALHAMMRRLEEPGSAIERRQVTFVLAALSLFVAYYTPEQLWSFGRAALGVRAASEAERSEAVLIALVMLASLGLLGALVWRLLRGLRTADSAAVGRESRLILACIGIGFGAAVGVVALAAFAGVTIEALGLFRTGSVALIIYAIARYQLFDLDLRVKSAVAFASATLSVGALAVAAWFLLGQVDASTGLGVALAAGAAVAAFWPLLRLANRLADRVAPSVSRAGEHLYLRKLEVYRAHVETLVRDGRSPAAHEPGLRRARADLGLTDRDHGVVVSLAVTRADPAGAAPDLRPGAVVFAKYAVDSVLAEGGFGRVFLARDRLVGRPVVIKELLAKWRGNPAVVKTFLREAQVAGQLNHPNIVAVYDVERHGEDYYVVMEYLSGGTLAERLGGGRLGLGDALDVANGVLRALALAHARGVVHRDVKPANVLLGSRGEVKLADFGIAQLSAQDVQQTISGLTAGAAQPGTLQYMSPEQARGAPVDARSDLYAVGALLYRMVAGRPHVVLDGLDELSARNAVASAAPPAAVPGAPDAVNVAIGRALAPSPRDRFASAEEFLAALPPVEAVAR